MKIRVLIVICAAAVLGAGTADAAAPPQTVQQLRAQLAASKKTVAKQAKRIDSLIDQRDDYDGRWLTAKVGLAKSTAAVTAMTADRDTQAANLATANTQLSKAQTDLATAQASIVGLQFAVNGQVNGLTDPQLWGLLGAIYGRMTTLGGSSYSASSFMGSALQSYDFDWFTI